MYLFFIALTFSCNQKQEVKPMSEEEVKKHLEAANKIMLENEKNDIKDFIQRHQYNMKETGTGLYYEWMGDKKSKAVQHDASVEVMTKILLLDGTLCHQDTFTIQLERGQLCNGIEEGIKLMHEGDAMRMVIPSHLGYGFSGNSELQIPRSAALYAEVSLLKIIE